MQQNFINLWEIIETNLYNPLKESFLNIEWIQTLIQFINNFIYSLFGYELNLTSDMLASLLSTTYMIVLAVIIVKVFILAFTAVLNFYNDKKKRKKGK